LNIYNIYTKSIYHKYDFVSENITPIKQEFTFFRRKKNFIKEHPEIISNNELLDFLCIKSSLILILAVSTNHLKNCIFLLKNKNIIFIIIIYNKSIIYKNKSYQ
jgi:hypothetical protein